ncbi:MAG: hypothetical protein AB7V34_07860, partial [Brachymonas sp.]
MTGGQTFILRHSAPRCIRSAGLCPGLGLWMLYERRYILDARVDNGGYGTIDPTEIAGFQSSERSQGYWTCLHVGAARSMAEVFDDEVDHGDNAQR